MDIKLSLFKRENELLKLLVGQLITDIELTNVSNCQICLDPIKPNNLILITNCKHFYCKKCLDTYILSNIKNRIIDMKCPNPKCSNKLDYQFILGRIRKHKNTIKLYETILLDKCIQESTDMVYCPKKECSKIAIKGCNTKQVNCGYCFNQFCSVCIKPYNDDHKCRNADLAVHVPDDLKEMFINKDNNMKICPGCKAIVIKKDGCNTMKCSSCMILFCWKCLMTDNDIIKNRREHNCGEYYGWDNNNDEDGSYESGSDNSGSDESGSDNRGSDEDDSSE